MIAELTLDDILAKLTGRYKDVVKIPYPSDGSLLREIYPWVVKRIVATSGEPGSEYIWNYELFEDNLYFGFNILTEAELIEFKLRFG